MAIRPISVLAQFRRVVLIAGVGALCGILVAGIALPVVAGIGITARESADAFNEMPADLEIQAMNERSRVVDADGKTLAIFYDNDDYNDGNRVYVGLDKIAPVMIDATLAIEDDRFYERGPIDFKGVIRAFLSNLRAGETTGGASTLTQQYVKQVRLTQAESAEERAEATVATGIEGYRRKLEELRMAVDVEENLSKDEILERYLNIAYFGNGAYGIETAARTYFSKSAKKLKMHEAALLAGMVQAPGAYDPIGEESKQAAINRRDTVLNRMAETGRASEAEVAEAKKRKLGLKYTRQPNKCVDSWAGYFCDYVEHELLTMKALGESKKERRELLYNGGLLIKTTLDREAQKSAVEHIRDRVDPTDEPIGSLAAVEPGTGYIRAMANSRIYGVDGEKEGVSSVNYATNYKMGNSRGIQPGSTFKTFVLAAAIDQGIGFDATMRAPSQLHYEPDETWETCGQPAPVGKVWEPGNYEGASPGIYNLVEATEGSINTYYVPLSKRTGLCRPATIAQDMGVYRADAGSKNSDGETTPKKLQQVPSFTLGVNVVSPLAMAEAYATFANRGVHCNATSVIWVKDNNGDMLVDHRKPKCDRVLDKDVADGVNYVLQSVVDNGTGQAMQLEDDRPATGKTGTTQDAEALWFVGHTPQLATAVAVADAECVPGEYEETGTCQNTLRGRTLGGDYIAQAWGSVVPGPVWKGFMDDYHEGLEIKEFNQPSDDIVKGETERVPDVRGRSIEEAEAILSDAGFTSYSEEEDSDLPEGTVIRTEPGVGSEVTKGSLVLIVVSNGEKQDDDENGNGNENGNDNGNEGGGPWGGPDGSEIGTELGTEFGTDFGNEAEPADETGEPGNGSPEPTNEATESSGGGSGSGGSVSGE